MGFAGPTVGKMLHPGPSRNYDIANIFKDNHQDKHHLWLVRLLKTNIFNQKEASVAPIFFPEPQVPWACIERTT